MRSSKKKKPKADPHAHIKAFVAKVEKAIPEIDEKVGKEYDHSTPFVDAARFAHHQVGRTGSVLDENSKEDHFQNIHDHLKPAARRVIAVFPKGWWNRKIGEDFDRLPKWLRDLKPTHPLYISYTHPKDSADFLNRLGELNANPYHELELCEAADRYGPEEMARVLRHYPNIHYANLNALFSARGQHGRPEVDRLLRAMGDRQYSPDYERSIFRLAGEHGPGHLARVVGPITMPSRQLGRAARLSVRHGEDSASFFKALGNLDKLDRIEDGSIVLERRDKPKVPIARTLTLAENYGPQAVDIMLRNNVNLDPSNWESAVRVSRDQPHAKELLSAMSGARQDKSYEADVLKKAKKVDPNLLASILRHLSPDPANLKRLAEIQTGDVGAIPAAQAEEIYEALAKAVEGRTDKDKTKFEKEVATVLSPYVASALSSYSVDKRRSPQSVLTVLKNHPAIHEGALLDAATIASVEESEGFFKQLASLKLDKKKEAAVVKAALGGNPQLVERILSSTHCPAIENIEAATVLANNDEAGTNELLGAVKGSESNPKREEAILMAANVYSSTAALHALEGIPELRDQDFGKATRLAEEHPKESSELWQFMRSSSFTPKEQTRIINVALGKGINTTLEKLRQGGVRAI